MGQQTTGRLRFIFDENHPPLLARVLEPLAEVDDYSVASVRHLGLAGTKDVELFRTFANPDIKTVLITADMAMSRRKHEVAAIRETGSIVVLCMKAWNQQKDTMERVRMMVWWWPTILQCAGGAARGSFLELPWASNVRPLRHWRA